MEVRKSSPFISRLAIDKVWRGLLILLPYLLIFHLKSSNALVILLGVTALFFALKHRDWNISWRSVLWCSSFFLLTLISAVYAEDLRQAHIFVDSRLPLIIVPLAFALKRPTKDDQIVLLRHFYYSLGLTFFLLLLIAAYRNYTDPGGYFNMWYWHYKDFTIPLKIEPLYLSLYVGFALLLCFLDLTGIQPLFRFSKKLKLLVSFVLAIFLVMLSSRWIISITLLMVVFSTVVFYRQISKWWIFGVAGFLIFFSILIAAFPVTRERFLGSFEKVYDFSNYSFDRLIIWSVALEYVRDHPSEFIIGKGAGNSKPLMAKLYLDKEIEWDFAEKTNTHNQYLDFLLNTGIVGLLWLLFFLVYSIVHFFRERHWIGFTFVAYFSLAIFCENYLQQQKGIVFFAIVYCILYLCDLTPSKTTKR